MALITIGAVELPNPYDYAVTRKDADSEQYLDETGVVHRELVRAGIYEIKASFQVGKTVLKTITDAVAPASFSCTFFDPNTVAYPTVTMRCGDRSALLIDLKAETDSEWDITIALTQY